MKVLTRQRCEEETKSMFQTQTPLRWPILDLMRKKLDKSSATRLAVAHRPVHPRMLRYRTHSRLLLMPQVRQLVMLRHRISHKAKVVRLILKTSLGAKVSPPRRTSYRGLSSTSTHLRHAQASPSSTAPCRLTSLRHPLFLRSLSTRVRLDRASFAPPPCRRHRIKRCNSKVACLSA